MGLIKNALQGVGNTAKDLGNSASGGLLGAFGGAMNQALFQEYFTSGDMSGDILMKRAEQVKTNGSANNKSDANVISNGSMIDVQPNQCMIIVENGRVVEACMEPGRYTYDTSIAPSFFAGEGKFGQKVVGVAKEMWEQAKVGGQRHNTQRIYFINMGVLDTPLTWGLGNVPFRHCSKIVDTAPAIRINMMLKANGLAKLRIVDALAFYNQKGAQKAGGDNDGVIRFSDYEETLFAPAKSNIREAVTSAVSQISNQVEIAYTAILSPENADLFRELANKRMETSELAMCGFGFAEFSVNGGFMPREEDMERLMDMEEKMGTMAFTAANPNMAAYDVQKTLAGNQGNMGQMAGMGMIMNGGFGNFGQNFANPQQYAQPAPQQTASQMQQPQVAAGVVSGAVSTNGWQCSCGNAVSGNFCPNCGAKKPEPKVEESWTCACGQTNTGNFCSGCGTKKPEKKKVLVCDKCGWSGDSESRFCPNCGDPVTEADFQ